MAVLPQIHIDVNGEVKLIFILDKLRLLCELMEQTVIGQLERELLEPLGWHGQWEDPDVTLVNDDDPIPPLAHEPANLLVHFGRHGARDHANRGINKTDFQYGNSSYV